MGGYSEKQLREAHCQCIEEASSEQDISKNLSKLLVLLSEVSPLMGNHQIIVSDKGKFEFQ